MTTRDPPTHAQRLGLVHTGPGRPRNRPSRGRAMTQEQLLDHLHLEVLRLVELVLDQEKRLEEQERYMQTLLTELSLRSQP